LNTSKFLHVLPKDFVRIRRYGLLSSRFHKKLLPLARTLLAKRFLCRRCSTAHSGTAPAAE
jgi:hypothetical protein